MENTIRYLRSGDEVDVTCAFEWSEGRTFRVRQEFPRPAGELAAELTGVGGLLDLRAAAARPARATAGRRSEGPPAASPELLGL
ncbi:hypothetical protein ACIBF7_23500 [Nonomuraea sp. NPDC050478]|uniref:hypothetical protein n=1 Tax=Nonomuraea TaxID=83681 RepID=UPI0036237353